MLVASEAHKFVKPHRTVARRYCPIWGRLVCSIIAIMSAEVATDREIIMDYLNGVLCPQLKDGDVVTIDILSSHKVNGVGNASKNATPPSCVFHPIHRT